MAKILDYWFDLEQRDVVAYGTAEAEEQARLDKRLERAALNLDNLTRQYRPVRYVPIEASTRPRNTPAMQRIVDKVNSLTPEELAEAAAEAMAILF